MQARVGPLQPRHFRHSASSFLLLRDVTDLIQISAVSSVQAGKRDVTKEVGAILMKEISTRVPVYSLNPAKCSLVTDYKTEALSALFAVTFVSVE